MDGDFYTPGIQVLVCQTTLLRSWWNRNNYSAPYWRLYWNPDRGASVSYAGVNRALDATSLILIPPETPYAAQCLRPTRHLYLHFVAEAPYKTVLPGLHVIRGSREVLKLVRSLLAWCEESADEQLSRRKSMAALALAHMALCHVPETSLQLRGEDARMVPVLQAMEANLAKPLSNPELAELAGMSTNAFIRLFQEVMGQTPQAMYVRKRIDRTCMQLHFSDMRIEQIAKAAGFCDRYHFSCTFKRMRGISPAAFRQQHHRGSGNSAAR